MRRSLALAILLCATPALADVTHPKPGLTYVKHASTAMVVADLCSPGVSVRATKYAERRATPRAWAQRSDVHAQAAVNADFFDFPGWTLVNGRARGAGEDWPADKQLFEFRSYWQFGTGVASLQPDAHVAPPATITEIVGGHNILIANGASRGPHFDGDGVILTSHRRTAVGVSADRRYLYLFVSNASMDGTQLVAALVQHAQEAGAPPIDFATNMDGGGSSQMYVEGVGGVFETGRQVNNHLGIHAAGSGAAPQCPTNACHGSCVKSASDRVAIAPSPTGQGYWVTTASGLISAFGNVGTSGTLLGVPLNQPIVAMAAHPGGLGYWLAAADGGVFSFGSAGFHGSMGGQALGAKIVGMASTADGRGYWLVGADGGVFAFGNAAFHGSMGGQHLNAPVVGMAATPDGGGYWLVARDGGIFGFGNAGFHGSMGGQHLNAPIVGMAATRNGGGYWLVASDGGIFSFGNAAFHGSTGGQHLNAPIVGMAVPADGGGYWLLGADGGIFSFGSASFLGSAVPDVGCAGAEVVSCEPATNGCLEWKPRQTCGAGEVCRNGRCEAACTDECVAGAVRCNGNRVESCGNVDADPCLEWTAARDCGAGKQCENGVCTSPVCADACVAGATRCAGDGLERCEAGADGCLAWSAPEACGEGRTCDSGGCRSASTTSSDDLDGGEPGIDAGDETPDAGLAEDDGGALGLPDASGADATDGGPEEVPVTPGGCSCGGDAASLLCLAPLLASRRRRRT